MTPEAEKAREMEPCPFCGKPARACPDTSYGYATVFCPDENECPVAPSADAEHTEGGLAEAINRWNTRAEKSLPLRGEVIEECARVAERHARAFMQGSAARDVVMRIAGAIRSLANQDPSHVD